MSTQSINSIASQVSTTQANTGRSAFRQDFRALESALLNGDTSGAQTALASLQQAITGAQGGKSPNSILSQLGDGSSTLGKDLQAVSSALGANDISGAQKAFATLQQDLQSARQANSASQVNGAGHHGHHAKANDGDADDAASGAQFAPNNLSTLLQSLPNSQSGSSSATDIFSALQSLAKSNPKVAGDLATLITDLNSVGTVVNTSA